MSDDIRSRFRQYDRRPVESVGYARPEPVVGPPAPSPQQHVAPHVHEMQAPVPPKPKHASDERIVLREPIKAKKPPKTPKQQRPKKKRTGIFATLLLISGLGAGGFAGYSMLKQESNAGVLGTSIERKQLATALPGEPEVIRFVATGDNLVFSSMNTAAKTADGYDYTSMFQGIKPLLDTADIRFCTASVPTAGNQLPISSYPSFNAPAQFSNALFAAGCNLVNLGTDHINDKGQAGIDATVSFWSGQTSILAHAGANKTPAEQETIKYFTVKDMKFAFVSFVTSSNNKEATPHGLTTYTPERAEKMIKEARQNAGFVIVGVQWGKENVEEVSPEQEQIAQKLAELNADVVIGNGPHVLQTAKVLNGAEGHQTLVWFSLGNLLNSQLPVNNLTGCMAVMEIALPEGSLRSPGCLPLYMHYEWSAAQKQRAAEADLLARKNFGVHPLDSSASLLPLSQIGTTVEAQTERIKGIITKHIPIAILTSQTLLGQPAPAATETPQP